MWGDGLRAQTGSWHLALGDDVDVSLLQERPVEGAWATCPVSQSPTLTLGASHAPTGPTGPCGGWEWSAKTERRGSTVLSPSTTHRPRFGAFVAFCLSFEFLIESVLVNPQPFVSQLALVLLIILRLRLRFSSYDNKKKIESPG